MRFIIDTITALIIIVACAFLVYHYWGSLVQIVFPNNAEYTIYLRDVAISASVAKTEAERIQGLSGVSSLAPQEGKLFIFDDDSKPGIWMKDMKFPLDIIWINRDFKVVHIAQNVSPNTYPQIFYPREDARFVLEVNAYFVSNFRLQEGDTLSLPASLIPADLRNNLQ